MGTINERIAYIVKQSGLNKTAFAERINVSQSMVSLICSGKTGVSDRTILDICRIFGVNELWLRTGEGDPFTPLSRAEELAEIFAEVQISDDAKSRLIRAMARMPDAAFPAFLQFIEELHQKMSEE